MKKIIIIITIILFGINVNSQESYYNEDNKKALLDLQTMIGVWEGSGWSIDPQTRVKENFSQKEIIQYELDSSVIIVKGIGMSNQEIVHDALAIISKNPQGDYYMTSFLGDGREGKYELTGANGNYAWKIPTPQGDVIYTIVINEDSWKEVGEFETNGQRYPFFEMNLKRIKSQG